MIERTLSIIKPDATSRDLTDKINAKFEAAGLRIIAQRETQMNETQAQDFYRVHQERPFFGDLVKLMISGPIVVQVLEGDDAIRRNREVMGATDPAQAAAGTIRAEFALSIGANSVHGSDSSDAAAQEIAFFFSEDQIGKD